MTQGELEGLLRFFKLMSDETRLKIIGLLSRGRTTSANWPRRST